MDKYDAGRGPAHDGYVKSVADAAGMPETAKLSELNDQQFEAVFAAIVQKESGGVSEQDRATVYDFPASLAAQSYADLINANGSLATNAAIGFLKANVPVSVIPATDYPVLTGAPARPLPHHVRNRVGRAPTSR
ncbi:MAG TPA: hypothetical protein VKZ53_16025 [Candidatus Angelobacter sp.]|nr:hypothetical protein [Candidatus Angelobacter sp.]